MKTKLALAIVWGFNLVIVLLGGWKLRHIRPHAGWRKVYLWEKTVHYRLAGEVVHLQKLEEAANTQENLWRIGK
jgi:hypothetical protein